MAVGALGQARTLRTQESYLRSVMGDFSNAYRRISGQSWPEQVFYHYRTLFQRGQRIRDYARANILIAALAPNQRYSMQPYLDRLLDAMQGMARELATAARVAEAPPSGTSRSDLEVLADAAGSASQAYIDAQRMYYNYSGSDVNWSSVPLVSVSEAFGAAGIDVAAGLAPGPSGEEAPTPSDPPSGPKTVNPFVIIGAGAAVGILGIGIWKRWKGER